MRTRFSIGAVAFLAAATVALLGFDFGAKPKVEPEAAGAATDVGSLVEQFSTGSTPVVVGRLESQAASRPADARTLTLLGLAYQQRFRETGDPSWLSRAGGSLARARADAPADALTLTALAQLAVTQHRFRDALPLAREALRRDPGSTAAMGALGDALVGTGGYRAAFGVFDRMAGAGPSVAAYARVAFARRLLGRPAAALEAMELALEAGSGIREQSAWAYVQYGNLLLEAGRYRDARRAFDRALLKTPRYVHAQAGLARADAAEGRYAIAARRLARVVELLPNPQYAILLGDVQTRAGQVARARRTYALVGTIERLLAANGVRTELQTALFDLDHGVRVREALDRALAAYRDARGIAAADAVGWGLLRTGRCGEARVWSLRALRLGTRDGLFLFHRGMIERCLGHDAEARTYMREALTADPQFSVRWLPTAHRLATA